jgi:hypothetical protein
MFKTYMTIIRVLHVTEKKLMLEIIAYQTIYTSVRNG